MEASEAELFLQPSIREFSHAEPFVLVGALQPLLQPEVVSPRKRKFRRQGIWLVGFGAALGGAQRSETDVVSAQEALLHRARCNRAARRGEYDAAMERI